jgi:hypothetical protein
MHKLAKATAHKFFALAEICSILTALWCSDGILSSISSYAVNFALDT